MARCNRTTGEGACRSQHVEQHDDLRPVGVLPALSLRVACHDRGLQLVLAGPAQPCGAAEQLDARVDFRAVPSRAVLICEQYQLTLAVEPGGGPRPAQASTAPGDTR